MTVTTADLGCGRVIEWERAARRNAWDLPTMTAIADAIEAAGADEAVRCVVLRGAGGHFSAGDDLHAAGAATRDDWAATIAAFQRLTRAVLAAPLPALAAIDGVCVGGALEFAASCDLRICTDRVRLLTPEVRIGFVLSNGGSLFLPHVLGEAAARELLLTGAERDAAWARAHGFASEMVAPGDLDAAVTGWVDGFEATSRTAVAATRRLLNDRWGALLEQALEREERACVELFDTPDAQAALRSFAARRRG
ncbi:MAG TPA: enoyl-CoA hydratase/isomerase family protein [Solirubrobacteraceae bacterium]|nr:enoyl-CoA hydratase/isomerase family protein [Solirubrobacteraceae bacterium]